MKIRNKILLYFIVFIILMLDISYSFWSIYDNSNQLNILQERRYASYRLAEQFRKSSDELTRMVRTYTMTGDIRFKHLFEKIIARGDGELLPPLNYQDNHWDLKSAENNDSEVKNSKKTLDQMMTELHFTEAEFATLSNAKALSGNLIKMEVEAFNAMKGLFKGIDGLYSWKGEPDREFALTIVYSYEYHQEKTKIMALVNDFFSILDARFQLELQQIKHAQSQTFKSATIIVFVLMLLSIFGYFYFKRSILTPLDSLLNAVKKVQAGRYDLQLKCATTKDEIGMLGKGFVEMAKSIQGEMDDHQKRLRNAIEKEKEISKKLKQKAQQLVFQQSALDKHAIVSITDTKGNFTYANDKLGDISQYTRKELLGQSYQLINSGFHPDSFYQDMRETLLKGKVWQGQVQNKSKNGSLFWVESTIVPCMNKRGHPEQYIAISTDITAVKRNEERLRVTIEATGDAVWDWDVITGEFNVSSEYNSMFGYMPMESGWRIETWINSVHPDDLVRIQKALKAHLQEKNSLYEVEVRVRCQDNSWKWVLSRGAVITMDSSGKPVEMTGLFTDISHRKALEFALLQEKEEAEKANNAKSEFLSSMSHELRTPLNAILGFSQLLESDTETPLTEEQKENVDYIISGGKHLLALINQVLELSAIESRQIELSPEPVQIVSLVNEVLSLVRTIANKANVQVHTLSNLALTVRADYTGFKQILINLLSNAIKYNKPGGNVSIDWYLVDELTIRVSIIDTGIGISLANQRKVFTAFNRFGQENSTIEGTGIGLVVTQKLIEMMAGKIGFNSLEHLGSTFWFELPLVERQAVKQLNDSGKKNILYIEDNPADVLLMEKLVVRYQECSLISVNTAELAVGIVLSKKITLILMDINLPDMNEIDALQKLRENQLTYSIPIVAISAESSKRNINRCLSSGFDDFISKPFHIPDVQNVVDKYCING